MSRRTLQRASRKSPNLFITKHLPLCPTRITTLIAPRADPSHSWKGNWPSGIAANNNSLQKTLEETAGVFQAIVQGVGKWDPFFFKKIKQHFMATKKIPSLWARCFKNITEHFYASFFLSASSFCSYHGWLSRSNWLPCFHRRLVDRSLGEGRLRSFLRHFGLPFLLRIPIASLHSTSR